jgi:[methyl-Co(III) methanol-specific corrinoid protein]:coenzyme M methyltransferase
MNQRDRLLAVLDHQEVDRVPVVSPVQTGTLDLMRASGSFWPLAHDDAHHMFKLSMAAHTVTGLEGCRVPFEVSVDASAFGATTSYATDRRQPAITGRPVSSRQEAESMAVPDPRRDGRAPVVLEAVKALRKALGNDSPVLCGITSAFTLACQLKGEGEAMMDLIVDPDYLRVVLEKALEWDLTYVHEGVQAGADVVVLVDATASGDLLGPEHYHDFAFPYTKRIARAIRDEGGRSILHICGNTSANLLSMKATHVDGISVDQSMDMRSVKRTLGSGCAAVGNVSPTTTLLFLSPEFVTRECIECIEEGTDVLAPGCGFAPETPLANMIAMAGVRQPHHAP